MVPVSATEQAARQGGRLPLQRQPMPDLVAALQATEAEIHRLERHLRDIRAELIRRQSEDNPT